MVVPPIPRPSELVQRVKEVLGVQTSEELARRLGTSLRNVDRWEADESAPAWDTALEMLQLAGWLVTTDGFVDGRATAVRQQRLLEELVRQVEELRALSGPFALPPEAT